LLLLLLLKLTTEPKVAAVVNRPVFVIVNLNLTAVFVTRRRRRH